MVDVVAQGEWDQHPAGRGSAAIHSTNLVTNPASAGCTSPKMSSFEVYMNSPVSGWGRYTQSGSSQWR